LLFTLGLYLQSLDIILAFNNLLVKLFRLFVMPLNLFFNANFVFVQLSDLGLRFGCHDNWLL